MAERERERERFIHGLSAEMDAVDAQLDQWRTEFTGPGGEQQTATELEDLERRRDALRRRSQELEDFDGDAWDEERREIERARRDLQESLERVRQRLRH